MYIMLPIIYAVFVLYVLMDILDSYDNTKKGLNEKIVSVLLVIF